MNRTNSFLAAFFILCATIISVPFYPAQADLRSPLWWDPDGVSAGSDWHYRVPVTLPSNSAVNSTAKVDINFATLMTQLGISGTFDVNSVRVVRPNSTIATIQEYTDTVYSGATDATGNNQGEVRWLVQDGGAQTYYVYFDVTANGTKPVSTQTPINGNFEASSVATVTPTGWNTPIVTGSVNREVTGTGSVTVTSNPTALDGATKLTDNNPLTGERAYLFGHRSFNSANSDPAFTMTRAITVPATNPGSLTVRWRPEGWDSMNFDWVRIDLTTANSATSAASVEFVGPTFGNYATRPYSPNHGGAIASNTSAGYRHYNGYDCTRTGNHTQGMTGTTCFSQPWWSAQQDLTSYAGQTVYLRFRFYSDAADKTWFHIDDVEWSVVDGTLGTAEAFGVVISDPTGGAQINRGTTLSISATVDARPTGAGFPVTANIYDATNTLVASGIRLYNDGSHGDGATNDAIWTNNGSDNANPTYTIPAGATGTGWTIRVFARDASTSTLGAANNGLVHRNALPNPAVEANYWNIDDSLFSINYALISVSKTSQVMSDLFSGSNPKAIPGATVQYCIVINNAGPSIASAINAVDNIPPNVTYVSNSMKSGTDCATATTEEDDDNSGANEADPFGMSITGTTITATTASLLPDTSFAMVFEVVVN
jgi:uncharacterized repeat protein (TIGR01451 family)